MTQTKSHTPKIRFKEFSGEWEEKKLGEVCTSFSGGTPLTSNKEYYNGNIPFIKSGEINKSKTEQFITDLGLNNSSAKLVNKGDLLYALYGATSGQVGISKINGAINQAVLCIKTKENTFFLYTILKNKKDSILEKFLQGGQGNLSADIVKSFKFLFPSLPEQQKIASFLSSVDEKIEKIKEKKKNLEEYKKGVMQKIFSQEIRFKDENGKEFGEWEFKELGELLNYEQPTNYIVKSEDYNDSYNIPVLTAGKTFILGYTNENFGIFEAKNNPVIIFDDFTTSKQFVNFDFKVKSSAMKILKNIDDKISNIKYIFEFMETIKFSLGDEHKRYWISEYSKININIPTLKEQEKIADFLSGIDEKIEKVSDELGKMEEFKKGLLQGMFV